MTRRRQIGRLRRVAAAALKAYGIAPASLSLLHHGFNTTFTVTTATGERYVLHILRPVDTELPETQRQIRVESELWWLDRLHRDLGLTVPVPIRTPAGTGVVSVAPEGIEPTTLCTLVRWVGARSVRHRLSPTHLDAVGRLTARLHEDSAHRRVPDWFDRPIVDRADTDLEAELTNLAGRHVSPDAAEVIRGVFQRVRRAQDRLSGGPSRVGLIHADIHQGNYLFDRGAARLIDFGDCGWGHYLYDLAVTLSEVADSPRHHELRASLLAGYRQVRDLPPPQEAMIHDFVLLRQVQNLAWVITAHDDPNYRDRAAHAWEQIAGLAAELNAADQIGQ